MRQVTLIAVAAWAATAADAQQPTLPIPVAPGRSECVEAVPSHASSAFVTNFNAASRALQSKDWQGTLGGAALARPHARNGNQQLALHQLEIAAYREIGNHGALAEKLHLVLADPCVSVTERQSFIQMLEQLESGRTAPEQQ